MQAQRDALERTLQKYQELTRSLRAELNTLTPISALPAEILDIIFWFCITLCGRYDSERLQSIEPQRIRISQVCQKWRYVALQSARLWRTIILSCKLECAEEAARRTQNLPLIVATHKHWSRPLDKYISQFILPELPRIGHLELDLAVVNILDSLPGNVDARCLSSVKITGSEQGFRDYSFHFHELVTEEPPSYMFGLFRTSSLLHTVELELFSGIWEALACCTSLKHLTVLGGYIHKRPTITKSSFAEVTGALCRMSSLETLHIYCDFDTRSLNSPVKEIHLPRLHTLTMTGYSLHCAELLVLLSYPPSVFANLGKMDCHTPNDRGHEDARSIADSLRLSISKVAPEGSQSLIACCWTEDKGAIHVKGWTTRESSFKWSSLDSHLDVSVIASATIVEHFLRYLPLWSVRALNIKGHDRDICVASIKLLQSLENVQKLRIHQIDLHQVDALFALVDGRHPFPNLSMLRLSTIEFTPCPRETLCLEACNTCVHRLEHILKRTDVHGNPRRLKKLKICQPDRKRAEDLLSPDDLRMLVSHTMGEVAEVIKVVD